MKEWLALILELLANGKKAAIVWVIRSSGSSPGLPGFTMLVDETGRRAGTVGGGKVEYEAEQAALRALETGTGGKHSYNLAHNGPGSIGMVCGGEVEMVCRVICPDKASISFFSALNTCAENNKKSWLLFAAPQSENGPLAIVDQNGAIKNVLPADDTTLAAVLNEAKAQVLTTTPSLYPGDEEEYFSVPLFDENRCIVFGGGHVAQDLVPLLAHIGFRVTLFDDRPDYANRERFPDAEEIIVGDLDNIEESLRLREDDWVIVVTRGHAADYSVLRQILSRPLRYVGAIGSRKKVATVNARLLEAGIPQSAIDTVHSPIGLPIGAATTAEIAVSIAAELIQLRAERNASSHKNCPERS